MSRVSSLLNHPYLLGFDQLERVLDTVSKSTSDGYPPYNIEHIDDQVLRISLAVAGFTENDLEVTVEDNQLTIRGKQADNDDRAYLHRGIAARQFQRKFVLAEGMEVIGAHLDNGLLHIDLKRPEPESRTRRIDVKSGPAPDPSRVMPRS